MNFISMISYSNQHVLDFNDFDMDGIVRVSSLPIYNIRK